MKTITISGIIGWDATPADLREELQKANGEDVELVISSPGGFVSDGIEMFNLVRNYQGKSTARLSGYAMSMASYIPLAADRIVAEDNAIYMIHNVRGGVWGDHNEILRYGNTTKAMSGMLARAYAKHTGLEVEEIQQMMDSETYFFGQDMVDSGFVDEIIDTGNDTDQDAAAVATALARTMFNDCQQRLTADQDAMKKDFDRAAAVAAEINKQPRAQANAKPASKGAAMNLEQLKAEHPELVAAIAAEAREGMVATEDLQQQVDAARAEGASVEQQRIQDVRAQLIPGHEGLIEQMAFDGQSTGADAAKAIVAAEQKKAQEAAANIDGEANNPVPPSGGDEGGQKNLKRAEFNKLSQDEQRKVIAAGTKIVD